MRKFIPIMMAATALMASCTGSNNAEQAQPEFKLDTLMTAEQIAARKFTPEVMWKMARASSPILSPDGTQFAYYLTRYNLADNNSSSALFVQQPDAEPMQLTQWGHRDNSPQWSDDNKSIFFLSNRAGSSQIHSISLDTKEIISLSNVATGVTAFEVAEKSNKVWYTTMVKISKVESSELNPDMPKSQALVYDDLMARHWDSWNDGQYSHIFVADLASNGVAEAIDIMTEEPFDSPVSPYFDPSEITWNNAGTQLAYTSRKLLGYEYAKSTNSDIYLYNIESKTTKNLTVEMPGYDDTPVFSPDDKKIAWQSMRRAGNESDKDRLMVMNVDGTDKTELTKGFDYNAANLVWSKDADKIFFISPMQATHQICEATMDAKINVLTAGDHDYVGFTKVGDKLVAGKTTMSMATEFFQIDLATGKDRQLSSINKHIYDNVDMGKVEKRWVKTTDGKEMLTWVILPTNFDANKKYPTLLYCQGGPQSVVSQFWSYRWNFQLMANEGYVIVAPNRRGLPSFGQEWLDQISGDYSGQNIKDYFSAIDNVSQEPWSDAERLGCVGASYGGYSAFYLAGTHTKRFKAFVSHCGIFNFESMYGTTEELWFPNNDYGGAYWETNDFVVNRSYANSPHKLVNNWDTPILIIAGANDFRVSYTQSLEAFTAARAHGVPSKLVVFQNEAHQIFGPQNNVVWNREYFSWLNTYLKK